MKAYRVTVEFSGTKEYTIYAENPEHIEDILYSRGSFDSIANPKCDTVTENIVKIEEEETEQ